MVGGSWASLELNRLARGLYWGFESVFVYGRLANKPMAICYRVRKYRIYPSVRKMGQE